MTFTADGAAAADFFFFLLFHCSPLHNSVSSASLGLETNRRSILADHLVEYSCGKCDNDSTVTKGDMDKPGWGIG